MTEWSNSTPRAAPASALRDGPYKLVEFFEDGGRRELYNLRDDPNEKRDLAASQPDRLAAMARTLHAWQQETGASIPRDANPAYDPKADRPRGGQAGGGQPGGGQKPGEKPGQGGQGRGGKGQGGGNRPDMGKGAEPDKMPAGKVSINSDKCATCVSLTRRMMW